jgi:hypothetical protein
MPLYLVRWPSLVASIVHADDEEHLSDVLDEVASPDEALWVEYRGPLWVDVALGIRAEEQDGQWSLEGADGAASAPVLGARVEAAESDASSEMFHTVLAKAFPHLYRLIEDAEEEGSLEAAAVRHAALADLLFERPDRELAPWLKRGFRRGRGTEGE